MNILKYIYLTLFKLYVFYSFIDERLYFKLTFYYYLIPVFDVNFDKINHLKALSKETNNYQK